jgi:hypothetical protein
MGTYRIEIVSDTSGFARGRRETIDGLRDIDRARDASGARARQSANATADAHVSGANRASGASRTLLGDQTALVDANRQIGIAGTIAAAKMATGFVAVAATLRIAIGLARDFVNATKEGAEANRKLTQGFVGQRDRLRELATLTGKQADTAFTLAQAKFNAAAGLTQDEGLGFRIQFQNSAAQFSGSKISEKGHALAEQGAAQLIAAKGFDPALAGELAGSLLGFKDRSKMGDQEAATDYLGKLNSGTAILGRGKGRSSVLNNQFSMAAAAALNEDAQKGVFTDSDEVAAAVSVMAEKHDAAAAEMVRAANRGLRDFNDPKAGPLLKRAGVTPQTGFIGSLERIAPIINAEAKSSHMKTEDVLGKYFEDHLTREAIGVGINKGIDDKLFKDRIDYGKAQGGGAGAQTAIKGYLASDVGKQRLADSGVELAKTERGVQGAPLETVRRQATAELLKEGLLESSKAEVIKWISGASTFGVLPHDAEGAINSRTQEMLQRRKVPGMPAFHSAAPLFDAQDRDDAFGAQIEAIKSKGGDPFSDNEEVLRELRAQTKVLEDLRAEKARSNAGLPPPTPQALPGGIKNWPQRP